MNTSLTEREEWVCKSVGIVKAVGQFIKGQLHKVSESDIIEKEKHSLVSFVDIEAEKQLVAGLQPIIPSAGFITEEGTQIETEKSEAYWIIDPLDGTTNFLKAIPVFSVSVALVVDDELQIGIVYDIMQDECFYAWLGGGAYINGKKIHVSQINTLDESVLATGFPYARKTMPQLALLFQQILVRARGVRRLGSAAIDLAYTACGRFDGYYETRLNAWDIAAGILLVKESGGMVCDFRGNQNKLWQNHHIIAGNPAVGRQLLDICLSFPLED
jgi:myo-inositol-1(or 4)-monophosphatase